MATLGFLQNMGIWEWLIILAIVLLIFGYKLPGLGRNLGKSIGEFKSGLKEGLEETKTAGPTPAAPQVAQPTAVQPIPPSSGSGNGQSPAR